MSKGNLSLDVENDHAAHLVLVGQRLDAGDLAALGVLAARRPHVDLRVVLELFGRVEDAAAVVGADHGKLAVLAKVGRRDQLRLAVQLVPQRHLNPTKSKQSHDAPQPLA